MLRFVYTGCIGAGVLLLAGSALPHSNIDPERAFAWSESLGWINLYGDGANGVVVAESYLHGFAWSESAGWIWFGGVPGDGSAYTQEAGDTGVNRDGEGNLSGFAWGENIGWINFDTSSVAGPEGQVAIDRETGRFSGFAWSESTGWINFGHDFGVATAPQPAAGTGWVLLGE